MKNLWSDVEAKKYSTALQLRVYTSNLLGSCSDLVLHGGGNTSVKININNEDILYVKGSGWDLSSIKEEGFAPVALNVLLKMAQEETLSDKDMVREQKQAMINKNAPNPSVEAILHAIIPFKYVDHTHADSIVTISNTKKGKEYIQKIFPNFLVIPYVMPGFILAKTVYEYTKDFNWLKCDGIILLNHGVFTFDDDAKKSYDKMIDSVTKAEIFLKQNTNLEINKNISKVNFDFTKLKTLVEKEKNHEIVLKINQSTLAVQYASQENLMTNATKGLLTPEHIIRTKRNPLILENDNIQDALKNYIQDYKKYFETFKQNEICLNPAPNYVVIKNVGIVCFGKNEKEANIINDIVSHTIKAVLLAKDLGGYTSICLKDSFEMEYWELEQMKLKKK